MSTPRVSIVLPTRNGADTLPALLDALDRQCVPFGLEVIAVDSGSTDGTTALLAGRVRDLVAIEPRAFNHGLTRNLGVDRARGDLVVLLVQDALPASDTWLAELTAPLLADASVAGAFARQQPRPDASAVTRFALEGWAGCADTGWIHQIAGRAEFDALTPMARLDRCTFDNVCSCIRRSVWRVHPFRATPIGEDVEWAREVLLAGHRLAFAPRAVVVHSHDRSARYEFTRTRDLHKRLRELFGVQTIPALPHLARAIAATTAAHVRCAGGHPAQLPRALALAIAWPLGQYLGARSAATAVTQGETP